MNIYGRNCIVKIIDLVEAVEFLNTYHLQGFVRGTLKKSYTKSEES